ncbi:hypothetical protein C8F04DRAFT_1347226, partial [Mycena alexandri]
DSQRHAARRSLIYGGLVETRLNHKRRLSRKYLFVAGKRRAQTGSDSMLDGLKCCLDEIFGGIRIGKYRGKLKWSQKIESTGAENLSENWIELISRSRCIPNSDGSHLHKLREGLSTSAGQLVAARVPGISASRHLSEHLTLLNPLIVQPEVPAESSVVKGCIVRAKPRRSEINDINSSFDRSRGSYQGTTISQFYKLEAYTEKYCLLQQLREKPAVPIIIQILWRELIPAESTSSLVDMHEGRWEDGRKDVSRMTNVRARAIDGDILGELSTNRHFVPVCEPRWKTEMMVKSRRRKWGQFNSMDLEELCGGVQVQISHSILVQKQDKAGRPRPAGVLARRATMVTVR